jgi:hypothetical protein
MPRDGSGVYSLPAGNPVVTNTIIASAWANSTLSDIAAQLNNVFTRDGLLGPTGPFKIVDGTVNAPGLAFNSEPGLGWYRVQSGIIGNAVQGSQIYYLAGNQAADTNASYYPRAAGNSYLYFRNRPATDPNYGVLQTGINAGGQAFLTVSNVGTFTGADLTLVSPANINATTTNGLFLITAKDGLVVKSLVGSAVAYINKRQSGDISSIFGTTGEGNLARWQFFLGDGSAESAPANGSDAGFNSFNTDGSYRATPLVIRRNTGIVSMNAGIAVTKIYPGENTSLATTFRSDSSRVFGPYDNLNTGAYWGIGDESGIFLYQSNTAPGIRGLWCNAATNLQWNMTNGDFTYNLNNSSVFTMQGGDGHFVYRRQYCSNNPGGPWNAIVSDERTKTNIEPYTRGLADILAYQPVKYHYVKEVDPDESHVYIGRLSQHVAAVDPDMILPSVLKIEGMEGLTTINQQSDIYKVFNAIKTLH